MIFSKFKITGFFLIVLYSIVFPQSDFIDRFYGRVPTNKFLINQWNSDNGLPQNSVIDIAQTKDGYLWLATFDGLVRFDGSEFVVYNQSNTDKFLSNRITALSADLDGGLWVGAENGQILRFKNYKFTDFTNKLNNKNYPIFYISVIDSQDVCITTGKDFIVYKNSETKHFIHSALYTGNHVFNIIRNDAGQINILSNLGLDIINNGILKTFNSIKLSNLSLVKGYKTFKNNWFDSKFLLTYLNKVVTIRRKSLLANNYSINYIFIDSKKGIWLATKSGLFLETRQGEYKFSNQTLQDEIYKIFEDSEGNIWVGTATKGVIKLSKRRIYNIKLKNGVFNDVIYPIYQRENKEIWVGSNGSGLVRIKGKSIDYFSEKDGLVNMSIWSFFEDSNKKLWVGSYGGGLLYWTGNRFVKFSLWDSLISKSIFAIYEDKKGGLWIGSDLGVQYFYKNKLLYYSFYNISNSNVVRAIIEEKDGTLWFATDNGLIYFKNKEFHKLKIPGNYKVYNFRSLYIDKSGRLWAGTYGQGLYSCYKGKVSFVRKEDGLFDNVVSTILEDDYGNFWMTSNHGLYRVARKNLLGFINGKIDEIFSTVYQKNDGFLSNEFNGGQMPSSCVLKDGTKLFPSFGGLVAIGAELGKNKSKYHKIYIDKVTVNDKIYSGADKIIIPSSNNNVTFHLSVIEFNKPKQIWLRYQIGNLNNNWTSINSIHKINFANIPDGNYVLKIQEKSGNGAWKLIQGRLEFTVLATFYQTFWFYILTFAFFIVAIFVIYRVRVGSLKRRNDTLELLVKERTSSIETEKENTLNALKEVRKEKEKVDKANIEKTDFMRMVVHDLKNPISAVMGSVDMIINDDIDMKTTKELAKIIKDASNDSLGMITQFLNQSEVDDPRYKLEIQSTNIVALLKNVISENKIIAESKGQNLLFDFNDEVEIFAEIDENKIKSVLTNLISNAIKYSPINKDIKITFEDLNTKIKICIIDEGPGLTENDHKNLFNKFAKLSARPTGNETSTGLGLSIVKKIIKLHNGEVGVTSKFGGGSNFFIVLPKQQK